MKILHHNMEAKGREYMRLFNIIELAKQYMFLGLIFVLLMGMISAAGYFVVYKKIMKGKNRYGCRICCGQAHFYAIS